MSETNTGINKELDLSKRVAIRNVTNVDCYFSCIEKNMDAKVAKKSKGFFTINEILLQSDDRNPDFIGPTGDGSHATFYIEDSDVRTYLGFEDGKRKQEIIDEQAIINIFESTSLQTFIENLKTKIVTMGEKQTLRDVLSDGKVNAYDKIELANAYLRNEPLIIEKKGPGRPKKVS